MVRVPSPFVGFSYAQTTKCLYSKRRSSKTQLGAKNGKKMKGGERFGGDGLENKGFGRGGDFKETIFT